MGTQFQSLTTARTRVGESVQKYSAWNLEHHHVISKVRLQVHERIPEVYPKGGPYICLALEPKTNSVLHPPLYTPLSPLGRKLLCCGVSAWSLLGLNPNPNCNLNHYPQPSPNPIYLTKSIPETESPMCPLLIPPWNSQDWCRFSPGDVYGPNPNPS